MNNKKQSLHHQRRQAKKDAERRQKNQQPDMGLIRSRIMALLSAHGPDRSATPTDVARELDPENWRRYLKPVRHAAADLARAGQIEILRKGKRVDPDNVRGVIRLRIIPEEFREIADE